MRGHERPGDPRVVGAVVGTVAGSAFVLVNRTALPDPWPAVAFVGWAVLVLATAHAVLLRERDLPPPARPARRAGAVYAVSVTLMVLAIVVGARLLTASGCADLVPAWVALVVGLHFLPFARAFRAPVFRAIGLAMAASGCLGLLLGALVADVWAPAAAVLAGLAMLALVRHDASA